MPVVIPHQRTDYKNFKTSHLGEESGTMLKPTELLHIVKVIKQYGQLWFSTKFVQNAVVDQIFAIIQQMSEILASAYTCLNFTIKRP